MSERTDVADFRARADFEARRYGGDPWVFVRELLQNSRDAGACNVWIDVEPHGAVERIACRDDGEGMDFETAKRFLFTLYASNKGADDNSAGRFGIGFWSVLRFAPQTIIVRSRPAGGHGWQVRLDDSLQHAEHVEVSLETGTEVVLERPASGVDVEAAVRRAVHDDARFLRTRRDPSRVLAVFVNAQRCAAAFALPSPSLRFERRGMRGVVALGAVPRVELFAHGLRVRTAADLDDLLVHTRERRPRPGLAASFPQGLAPQVLLDSAELEVLMSRGDAREGRVLERMVHLARAELSRLVQSELDRSTPGSWWQRVKEVAGELRGKRWLRLATLVVVGGCAVGLGASAILRNTNFDTSTIARRPYSSTAEVSSPDPDLDTDGNVTPHSRHGYHDIAAGYTGPIVEPLSGEATPVDLSYLPADSKPFLGALRIDGIADDGSFFTFSPPSGLPANDGGLDFDLGIAAAAGLLRLPTPTGHAVHHLSVRLDGDQVPVVYAPDGGAAVHLLRPTTGRLSYRSGPAAPPAVAVQGRWPPLPPRLRDLAASLSTLPVEERIARSVERVRADVAYDRSPKAAARLDAGRHRGLGFFDRIVDAGVGDCDVQSSLLTALLCRAGVPARMAVGYVGENGSARPGLHAWVEVVGDDDRWRVVDVSASPGSGSAVIEVAASRPARPAPAVNHDPAGAIDVRPAGAVLAIAAGFLAALISATVLYRGRTRRSFAEGGSVQLSELVRGALTGALASTDVRGLFVRPLVPLLDSTAISLAEARDLAHRGRLYRSDGSSPLALRAVAGGARVVDCRRPVGRVVAELLGAGDLDPWSTVMERCQSSAVTRRVEAALAGCDESWQVRIAEQAPEEIAILDLGFERTAVIDEASAAFRKIHSMGGQHPAYATFALTETLVSHLVLPTRVRDRLLRELARRALEESSATIGVSP